MYIVHTCSHSAQCGLFKYRVTSSPHLSIIRNFAAELNYLRHFCLNIPRSVAGSRAGERLTPASARPRPASVSRHIRGDQHSVAREQPHLASAPAQPQYDFPINTFLSSDFFNNFYRRLKTSKVVHASHNIFLGVKQITPTLHSIY